MKKSIYYHTSVYDHKELKRQKPKIPLWIQKGDLYTSDEREQTEIATEYFKTQFCTNAEPLPEIPPAEMRQPFTTEEIGRAVKTLQNEKSPGVDNLRSELLKYGPEILHTEIAEILNEIARTGTYPDELTYGILTPLQKPGKPRGPVSNLRPIILLSMLRKVLAVCLLKRISDRVNDSIPMTQAAYRQGRNTTEHTFATKLLAEWASTSSDKSIHLLMLDMSKAFDTIDRKTLLNELGEILNQDEVHLMKLLLSVNLSVRIGDTGDRFATDTGAPQGDCLSALEFTFYLAKTLEGTSTSLQPPEISVNMEYADDMSRASTDERTIKNAKETLPDILKARNLKVNTDKTEEYTIKKTGDDSWKRCKFLGTLLDTENEIKRRKGLAIDAIRTKKKEFNSKRLDRKVKIRIFNTYISSIFLFNSEVWTMSSKEEQNINAFQRKLIKSYILNIFWPNKISNRELYRKTGMQPWSNIIKYRRYRWFGHVSRLDSATPAKTVLMHCLNPVKLGKGRPKTTWLSKMKGDIQNDFGMSIRQAIKAAKDRKRWRGKIKGAMS